MPSAFTVRAEGPSCPSALPVNLPGIPEGLRSRPQWVAWGWHFRESANGKPGKWTKVPTDPRTGRFARVDDPSTWGEFGAAYAHATRHRLPGVGFVFRPDGEELFGCDLDHARDATTGQLLPWAADVLAELASYADVSPSATGVKVVGVGRLPGKRRRRGHPEGGGVEMYDRARFFTLTGHVAGPAALRDCSDVLAGLQARLLESPAWLELPPDPRPAAPPPSRPAEPDDERLLRRARESDAGEKFDALWRGDTGYHGEDDSAADLALCNYLAFWCGPDPDRVDRLFRRSGLMRPKWDARRGSTTYGRRTVELAMAPGREYAQPPADDGPTLVWGKYRVKGDSAPSANGTHPGEKAAAVTTCTLIELLAMDLPPPVWAVPGLLSEGLSLLAGKPKLGKSMMAFNLALTVAGGGKALGDVQVTAGDVLYLSLEDRLRRVQDRARKMLRAVGCPASARLRIAVEWPRIDKGGLDAIGEWMGSVERPTLVVIDVWTKFRAPYRSSGNQYDQDYQAGSLIKSVADAKGCSVLALHHCKKAAAEDVFDEISGTLGISGVADGSIVLRRQRGDNDGTLHLTGRDIEEKELAVRFAPETLTWTNLGDAKKFQGSKIAQAVLDHFRKNPGATYWPGEIATQLGKDPGVVKTTMWRMASEGVLRKVGGKYAWPPNDAPTTEEADW